LLIFTNGVLPISPKTSLFNFMTASQRYKKFDKRSALSNKLQQRPLACPLFACLASDNASCAES